MRELAEGLLVELGGFLTMEIRLYRSANKKRAEVERIWELASKS